MLYFLGYGLHLLPRWDLLAAHRKRLALRRLTTKDLRSKCWSYMAPRVLAVSIALEDGALLRFLCTRPRLHRLM